MPRAHLVNDEPACSASSYQETRIWALHSNPAERASAAQLEPRTSCFSQLQPWSFRSQTHVEHLLLSCNFKTKATCCLPLQIFSRILFRLRIDVISSKRHPLSLFLVKIKLSYVSFIFDPRCFTWKKSCRGLSADCRHHETFRQAKRKSEMCLPRPVWRSKRTEGWHN